MDAEAWGGAQWVTICWIFAKLAIPVFFRAISDEIGVKHSSLVDWSAFYLNVCASSAAIVAVLWWGGFWQ